MINYKEAPIQRSFIGEHIFDTEDTFKILMNPVQTDFDELKECIDNLINDQNNSNWYCIYDLLSQGLWEILSAEQYLIILNLIVKHLEEKQKNLSLFCIKTLEILLKKRCSYIEEIGIDCLNQIIKLLTNILLSISCLNIIDCIIIIISILVFYMNDEMNLQLFDFFIMYYSKAILINSFPLSNLIFLFSELVKNSSCLDENHCLQYIHLSQNFLLVKCWNVQYEALRVIFEMIKKYQYSIYLINNSLLIYNYIKNNLDFDICENYFLIISKLCDILQYLINNNFLVNKFLNIGFFNKLISLISKDKDLDISIIKLFTILLKISQDFADYLYKTLDYKAFEYYFSNSYQEKNLMLTFIFSFLKKLPLNTIQNIGEFCENLCIDVLDSYDMEMINISLELIIYLINNNYNFSKEINFNELLEIENNEIHEKLNYLFKIFNS